MEVFPFTTLTLLCVFETYEKISRCDPHISPKQLLKDDAQKIDAQKIVLLTCWSELKGAEKVTM